MCNSTVRFYLPVAMLALVLAALPMGCGGPQPTSENFTNAPPHTANAYLPFVSSVAVPEELHAGRVEFTLQIQVAADANPLVLAGYDWYDQLIYTGDPGSDPYSTNAIREFKRFDRDSRTFTIRPWILSPPMIGVVSETKKVKMEFELTPGTYTVRIESAPESAHACAEPVQYRYYDEMIDSGEFLATLPSVYKEFTFDVLPAEAAR